MALAGAAGYVWKMPDDNSLTVRDAASTALDVATGTPMGTALKLAHDFVGVFQVRATERRAARAMQVYLDSWSTLRGIQPGQAEAEVARMLHEGTAEQDEALYQMFRSMAFSRSPAAWPYIARMTAEYINEQRPADEFFRRLGLFLERAAEPDVRWCSYFADVTQLPEDSGNKPPAVRWGYGFDTRARGEHGVPDGACVASYNDGGVVRQEACTLEDHQSLAEFFQILTESRLAHSAGSMSTADRPDGTHYEERNSVEMTFRVRRIIPLFRKSTPPS